MTELERRIQVEEIWARRRVLCEIVNAKRLKAYRARRSATWMDDALPSNWDNSVPLLHEKLDFEDLDAMNLDAF